MTPGGCSSCTGVRVDGCLVHTRECQFHYPTTAPSWVVRDFCFAHPDICELDSFAGYWYPDLPRSA